MLTRRDFIKQASLLTTIVVAASKNFGFFKVNLKPKVVIIGSGFAGLAAGYALSKRGIDVTILEARSRLGGRVYSYKIEPDENLVVELGAEWIGSAHTRTIELCQELGLELQNNQFNTHLIYRGKYFHHNEWSFSEDWNQKFERLLTAYSQLSEENKMKLDKIDWWRYLVDNGISDRDLDFQELFNSTDFGESIRFVSAFVALDDYAEAKSKYHMDYKIKGGNNQLAKAMAAKIGLEKIQLNRKVVSIIQSGKLVTITCDDGYQVEADKVICTLPTFAIKNIKWQPSLPEDKLEAINELQYARINKNALLYSQRFWQDESFDMITDGPAHYFYHASKNQPSQKGALISYTIGDKADLMARQSDAGRISLIESSLQPAFGSTRQYLLKQINYFWGSDEYARGSYALYGKGQWFSVKPILKRKFKNVHFAGEHVADWQGYMEGAVNTGEEAVAEIFA